MQQPKVDEQWDGRLICQGSEGQVLASAQVQAQAIHQDVTRNPILNHAEATAMTKFYMKLADKLAEKTGGEGS